MVRPLTQNESRLYKLLLTGMDQKQIAHEIHATENSIKVYCSRLYRKLEVSGRIELMAKEIERLVRW